MKKNVIDLLGKTVRVKNEKQLRKLTKIARKQGFRFKNLNEAAMSKVFCFYEMFGVKIIEKPFIIFEENVTEFKDIFITPTKDDLLAERIKLQNKVIAINGNVEKINDQIVRIDNHKKPRVGDVCYFWDDNMNTIVLSVLEEYDSGKNFSFGCGIRGNKVFYQNCKKVTNTETLNLWEEQRAKQTDK